MSTHLIQMHIEYLFRAYYHYLQKRMRWFTNILYTKSKQKKSLFVVCELCVTQLWTLLANTCPVLNMNMFTCPKKAVLFSNFFLMFFLFFADSRRKKSFQPVKNFYFCVGLQIKKELLEKNSRKMLFWNM